MKTLKDLEIELTRTRQERNDLSCKEEEYIASISHLKRQIEDEQRYYREFKEEALKVLGKMFVEIQIYREQLKLNPRKITQYSLEDPKYRNIGLYTREKEGEMDL